MASIKATPHANTIHESANSSLCIPNDCANNVHTETRVISSGSRAKSKLWKTKSPCYVCAVPIFRSNRRY
jgi:hypothetical protein